MTPTPGARTTAPRAAREAPPRAVLFDFDGVVADTENHHVAAWQRTFALMGLTVDDAACCRAMEVDDRAFLTEEFARLKIEGGNVEGWVRRKQDLTLAMLRDAPRVYPGVAELVAALAGRVRLAVVTTTWRANVDEVLRASGLAGAFELIVGKEDVAATKPDPEPYRLAVKTLKIKGSEAVALEDSPTGLSSARGAGVRALAVGHRRAPGQWTGASPYLPDLRDTAEALARIGLTS